MAKVAARQLSEAGEVISVSGSQRRAARRSARTPTTSSSGKVEIFTVGGERRTAGPARARTSSPCPRARRCSAWISAMRAIPASWPSGKGDTVVRRIPRDSMAGLTADPHTASEVGPAHRRVGDAALAPADRRHHAASRRRRVDRGRASRRRSPPGSGSAPRAGVAWIDVDPDVLLYIGMATLPGDDAGGSCPFPVDAPDLGRSRRPIPAAR